MIIKIREVDLAEVVAAKLELPLEPYQFHAMVEIIEAKGKTLNIAQIINAMPNVSARAVARAKYNKAKSFLRNDPLVVGLSASAGLTTEEMDEYWLQALEL